jgi:hypothetical protein
MDTETGVAEAEPRRAQRPARRFALGLFGLILGVAGLATAVAGPFAAEALAPPPEPAKKAAEVIADAGDKLAGRLIDRVKGKRPAPAADAPPAPQPVPWAWYFSAAAMSLGFAGALSGAAGWMRRENPRVAAGAVATGAVAVGWVYLLPAVALAAAVIILLVAIRLFLW